MQRLREQKMMPRRLQAEKMISNSSAYCRRVQEQIPALSDGSIPEQKRYAIERHLVACHECSIAYADYQRVEQVLDTARFALPPAGDLLPGFIARIEAQSVAKPVSRIGTKRRRITYALAAPAFALGTAAIAFVFGTSIAPHHNSFARHENSPSMKIASRTTDNPPKNRTIQETRISSDIDARLSKGSSGVFDASAPESNSSSLALPSKGTAEGTRDKNNVLPNRQIARVDSTKSRTIDNKAFRAFADDFATGLSDSLSYSPNSARRAARLNTDDKVWERVKSTPYNPQIHSLSVAPWALSKQLANNQIALADEPAGLGSVSSDREMMDTNLRSDRYKDSAKMGESIVQGEIDINATSFALGLAYRAQSSQPEIYYYESESAAQEPDTTLVVQDDARGFTSIVQTVPKPVDGIDPDALRVEEDTDSDTSTKPNAKIGR